MVGQLLQIDRTAIRFFKKLADGRFKFVRITQAAFLQQVQKTFRTYFRHITSQGHSRFEKEPIPYRMQIKKPIGTPQYLGLDWMVIPSRTNKYYVPIGDREP